MKNTILTYAVNLDGHRGLYSKAIGHIMPSRQITGRAGFKTFHELLKAKKTIIFLTIEDSIFFYIFCAFVRGVLGRKTIGLSLYAVKQKHNIDLKGILKIYIMRVLSMVDNINTVSIIPFDIHPPLQRFCSFWIYDPAFWDLMVKGVDSSVIGEDVISSIKRSTGNKIVLYLGSLDNRKGFDDFVKASKCANNKNAQLSFIAAGHQGINVSKVDIDEFKSSKGYLINRRLTENEVLILQESADVFWALYPKSFDQSSGICGRGFQLRKPVIVRSFSFAEKIMNKIGANIISINDYNASYVVDIILRVDALPIDGNGVSPALHCFNYSKKKLLQIV